MKAVFKFALALGVTLLAACQADVAPVRAPTSEPAPIPERGPKINGVSFVAPPQPIKETHLANVKQVNGNAVAVMPFALASEQQPGLRYGEDWQWWGETEQGIRTTIQYAHLQDLNVLLKPQLWIHDASYTGRFNAGEHWKELEEGYRKYILLFAQVAEEEEVAGLCIGTELSTFIEERPQFWDTLIYECRQVYSGKLTYAANWDNYKNIPFWNKLDYVGVDAYFPLSKAREPSREQLLEAWQPWKDQMRKYADSVGRQVLFCEYGYRSRCFTTMEPWSTERKGELNLNCQVVAYEALFETFWTEPWFAGGYLWKWFPDNEKAGGENNNRFTPQNKPVIRTITRWYEEEKKSKEKKLPNG